MICEITNKIEYENFLTSCDQYNFLQSWEWGTFNQEIGNNIKRFAWYESEQIISVCTLILERTKLASFAVVQCGPVFRNVSPDILEQCIKDLKIESKKLDIDILRIGALLEEHEEYLEIFKKYKFKSSTAKIFANHTSILSLEDTQEDLLKKMRKTTRYLIKQKDKFNIEIQTSISDDDVKLYCEIEKDTVVKHKFNPYPFNRILNEVKAFSPNNCLIYKAIYDQKVISMAIIFFYGNEADYLYGASLQKYSNIPSSYIIQWEAIKEAKKRGYSRYNFWGISEQFKMRRRNQITHPLWGITQFKKGFGGEDTKYMFGFDYICSNKGRAQRVLEIYRSHK